MGTVEIARWSRGLHLILDISLPADLGEDIFKPLENWPGPIVWFIVVDIEERSNYIFYVLGKAPFLKFYLVLILSSHFVF